MEETKNILEKIFSNNLINSIIVILISIFIYRILYKFVLNNKQSKRHANMSKRNRTYLRVLTSIVRYAFIIITVLIVLQINGVNVNSILAGAGIIGIIIGFAVQDALKDIIRGMTILTDSYFQVGDVVKYGDVTGKVISTGLSTTKIEDIRTFNILSIANRNIDKIEVVSDSVDIMIPLSYELPLDKAEKVLNQIVENVNKIGEVSSSTYKGISNFKDSCIEYYLNVHCSPVLKRPVTRQVNGIILKTLEANKIKIPYNQLDVHQK